MAQTTAPGWVQSRLSAQAVSAASAGTLTKCQLPSESQCIHTCHIRNPLRKGGGHRRRAPSSPAPTLRHAPGYAKHGLKDAGLAVSEAPYGHMSPGLSEDMRLCVAGCKEENMSRWGVGPVGGLPQTP